MPINPKNKDFLDNQRKKFLNIPDTTPIEDFLKLKRKEASDLISKEKWNEAEELLMKLTGPMSLDLESYSLLGDLYLHNSPLKDPWKAIMCYVGSMNFKEIEKINVVWSKLKEIRESILSERGLGKLMMNDRDVEYICCEKLLESNTQAPLTITLPKNEGGKPTFGMSMDWKEHKDLIKKKKNLQIQKNGSNAEIMGLTSCPYCGAELEYCEVSDQWKLKIDETDFIELLK